MKQRRFLGLALLTLVVGAASVRAQTPVEVLAPWDSGAWGDFGWSLDGSGSVAVVGDLGRGQAFVYEKQGGAWAPQQILVDSDLVSYKWGSTFASAVAVWDDWIAVGEPSQPVGGGAWVGSVHLFRRNGGSWEFFKRLEASNSVYPGSFGSKVDMSDGVLAVSAPDDHTPTSGPYSTGSVYVYEWSGQDWSEAARLSWSGNPNNHDGDFGADIAVDSQRILIGTGGHYSFGEGARLFEKVAGNWKLTRTFALPLGWTGGFGASVDLRGNRLAIGASPFDANVSGAAFIFEKTGTAWLQIAALKPNDTDVWHSFFGYELVLMDEGLLVGAHGTDNGAVYLFMPVDGIWRQTHRIDRPLDRPIGYFGWALAESDGRLLVSAPTSLLSVGGADSSGVVLDVPVPFQAIQFCPCDSTACGIGTNVTGCANSTGKGGVLEALGSGSVIQDDMVLEARSLPADARAVCMMARDAVSKPFGAGLLCLGGTGPGILRFPPAIASFLGAITLGPGIVEDSGTLFGSNGQIQAGDTWYFQTWYRDPINPCGSGVNLTNGLQVQFGP